MSCGRAGLEKDNFGWMPKGIGSFTGTDPPPESDVGPSGVRALPLAAAINEGGHYFRYLLLLSCSSYHRCCHRVPKLIKTKILFFL